MSLRKKEVLYPALLGALLLLLDQLTKYLAGVCLRGKELVLIPGVLELCWMENRGAAFGILRDRQWLFILLALLFLTGAVLVFLHLPHDRGGFVRRILCAALAAGAAGNLIDRIFLGYVRDFIYVSLIDFPVFNVADICVTAGAAALILVIARAE